MSECKQPGWKTSMRQFMIVLLTVMVAGCSVSKQLTDGHLAYNEAVRIASDQEILLNIVRLRYLEPMEFLAITSINSTVSFSASLDVTAGRIDGGSSYGGEATAGYSNSPTFSFVPQRGSDFSARLTKPLNLEALIFLATSRRDVHTVFRLFVTWLNGLNNHEGLVDPGFIDVTRQLTQLQYQGEAIFGFLEQERVVSPLIPPANLTPEQIIEAYQAGLNIQKQANGDELRFSVTERQAMLNFDPHSGDVEGILAALKLDSGLGQVPIALEAELSEDIDKGTLALRTRSLLHTLSFLSQGIDVPEKDISSGVASWPWPHNSVQPVPMDDIFRVRYSDEEPEAASLAVKYGDGWFFIREDDAVTKRTFLLISDAFRFALESNAKDAPTLTIPVGGG